MVVSAASANWKTLVCYMIRACLLNSGSYPWSTAMYVCISQRVAGTPYGPHSYDWMCLVLNGRVGPPIKPRLIELFCLAEAGTLEVRKTNLELDSGLL